MDGVFIRSKAKWIEEGEKPTKYFCNLENRNYVPKFMNSLISESGESLKTQDQILSETKRHYQKLYEAKETEDVSLHDLLRNIEVPKLNENEMTSIEWEITYTEMLSSLKRMSNNTSPGNDGFTVEFYKFFWNDIGTLLVRSINHAFFDAFFTVGSIMYLCFLNHYLEVTLSCQSHFHVSLGRDGLRIGKKRETSLSGASLVFRQ